MAIETVLRWVVRGGVLVLPFVAFIVVDTLFFPFITGKNFAFRIIVEIITGAYMALALLNTEYRPRRSWILGAFALLTLVMACADAFGVNPARSFWSNFERMDGFVTLAHLFAYLVVAASVFRTEGSWRSVWYAWLASSFVMSLYGLSQLFGKLAISSQSGVRLDTTFGNATYLAVYMLFTVFIAAYLLADAWQDSRPKERIGATLVYGTLITLGTIVLFFTATRGAILGLLLGALVAFAISVWGRLRTRYATWGMGVVAVVILLAAGTYAARDSALVRKIEPLQRLTSISVTDTTVVARFMNWNMAWQGLKERPLLGWGQENYGIVFDKYYDPNMYAQEQWFDRVHNIVFDWLIAGGILGFLAYALIYLAAMAGLWASGAFTQTERGILTGLLVGYLFHNLFVFDNLISYILFVTVLAYIAARVAHARGAALVLHAPTVPRSLAPIVAVVAVLAVWGVAYEVNAAMLSQNKTLLQALAPQKDGPAKNLELFRQAIAYNTAGTQEAREQLMQSASQALASSALPDDLKRQFLQAAVDEMSAQAKAVPLEARFPLFLGVLLDAAGDYTNARQALLSAQTLSPQKQSILFELGVNAMARNANDEALRYFKEAYDAAPAYDDAFGLYVAALVHAGHASEADALLAPVLGTERSVNQRLTGAYARVNRYDKVEWLWQAYVNAHPNDPNARLTLAAAYFTAGDYARTIEVLRQAAVDIPSMAAQVQTLIAQVQEASAGKK